MARFRRQLHAVANKIGFVVNHQEGVARKLLAEGGGFGDAVVVADVQAGGGGQGFQFLQAAVERVRVAAVEVARPQPYINKVSPVMRSPL